jgi:rapamycin-insensitive companion of mTOR
MPPHFYGELVRTSEGFSVLKNSGHFQEFRDIILSPDSSALEKRGALWVMGQIGKSKKGFKFLESEGVVQIIVDSALKSSCLPIRRYVCTTAT